MTIAVHDDGLGAWRGAWIGELLRGEELMTCSDPFDAVRSDWADAAVVCGTELPGDLEPAAFCERGDIREALIAPGLGTLEQLPEGTVVGADTPLRRAQLALRRPDLTLVELTGSLEQQLEELDHGMGLQALVAGYADLSRLGLAAAATEIFAPELFMPAIGQGGTVVLCRKDDLASCTRVHEACDHFPARRELVCEWQFRRLNPNPLITACALASDRFLYLFMLKLTPEGKATRLRSSVPVGEALQLAELATRELAQSAV
jgi:hydroxymethylbilane synthase